MMTESLAAAFSFAGVWRLPCRVPTLCTTAQRELGQLESALKTVKCRYSIGFPAATALFRSVSTTFSVALRHSEDLLLNSKSY